jgi:hypothetical protein
MTPFALQVGSMVSMGQWEPLGRRSHAQLAVTLRAFHWESRAGEPDARYFTVQLTEFKDAPLLQKIIPPNLSGQKNTGRASHTRGAASNRGGSSGGGTTASGQRLLAVLDPNDLNSKQRTLRAISVWAYGGTAPWRLILKASGLDGKGIGPDDDLRKALGSRKPPVKIKVPHRTPGDMTDNAKTR